MDKDLDRLFREMELSGRHGRINPAGILSPALEIKYLDTASLELLESAFRQWSDGSARADVRISRKRITLIFLLIRYTGARLGEILSLNETEMIDPEKLTVRIGHSTDDSHGNRDNPERQERTVEIPESLASELAGILSDPSCSEFRGRLFDLDPAHVRRKFYETAEKCGFPRESANPSAIRRSRAIELIRSNIPLPMVQKILGHSTSELTSSYIGFSDDNLKKVLRNYVDRESRRKTSARNSFSGVISRINRGDIQSEIEITTFSGIRIISVITNGSIERLLLTDGMPATAEIKAPWVIVSRCSDEPAVSASNMLKGRVTRIITGAITTEIVVGLDDGTEVCALITEQGRVNLDLEEGTEAWVIFSAFSVIINVD